MLRGSHDNWEKLVGAVLDREELRRIAHCQSLSTSISNDFSLRSSFDSANGKNKHKLFLGIEVNQLAFNSTFCLHI